MPVGGVKAGRLAAVPAAGIHGCQAIHAGPHFQGRKRHYLWDSTGCAHEGLPLTSLVAVPDEAQLPTCYGSLTKTEEGVNKEEVPGAIPCGWGVSRCPPSVGITERLSPQCTRPNGERTSFFTFLPLAGMQPYLLAVMRFD